MASWVTCFLSLTLLLEVVAESGGSEHFQMFPKKEVAHLGQKVKLTCKVLSSNSQGCSWLFQKRGSGIKPTFLIYVSMSRNVSTIPLTKLSGKKSGSEYILTLNNFSKEDEGYYFCFITVNSVVHFSPLVPVFLPEKPTTPVPQPTTPVPTTGTSRSLRPEVCRPGAGTSVEKKGFIFDCDIIIWAPLAGICGVLLLSLFITLICYHRNRRRVCKCPRPQVRQGGKPSPSGKIV